LIDYFESEVALPGCPWKLVTIVSKLVYELFTGHKQPTYILIEGFYIPFTKYQQDIPVVKIKHTWSKPLIDKLNKASISMTVPKYQAGGPT